jgi:murein DD-endopeptidase MepM/ murein hydrolase activator NlpD
MKNRSRITFFSLLSMNVLAQNALLIEQKPKQAYLEQGENSQQLNVDFKITNTGKDTFQLTKMTVSVFDPADQLLYTRFLDNNGTSPSINLIPNRIFNGESTQLIFNPFTDFSLALSITKLNYEFVFTDNKDKEIKFITAVFPKKYMQNNAFLFPLKGRVLVYDAHDFYAHHRRFDYEFAPIRELGMHANFMRYAYDFVLLDDKNNQYSTDGKTDGDYIGFGKEVYAIGEGNVIYASNAHNDDKTFDMNVLAKDPLELYGNCIAIQHANGSVSVYGHLKHNSVTVKVGDQVKAQQIIGRIGVSGSSFFPHLHFEVRTAITADAEGLPSYFSNVYLLTGKTEQKLNSGLVETGVIIKTHQDK